MFKFRRNVIGAGMNYYSPNMAFTFTEGGDTGGGGGQQTTGQQQQPDNQGGNNNQGDNVDLLAKLWENDSGNKGGQGNNNGGQQQTQQQTQQANPNELIRQHLDGLSLKPSFSQEDMDNIQNGDFTAFNREMQSVAERVYTQALSHMAGFVDQKVNAAIEEATRRSGANYEINEMVDRMQNSLPITKDPKVAPVAKGILQQALKKGMKADDAINAVSAFFNHLNPKSNNQSRPGRDGRPSGNNNQFPGNNMQDENSQDLDWLQFMGIESP